MRLFLFLELLALATAELEGVCLLQNPSFLARSRQLSWPWDLFSSDEETTAGPTLAPQGTEEPSETTAETTAETRLAADSDITDEVIPTTAEPATATPTLPP